MRDKIVSAGQRLWQKDFVKHLSLMAGASVISRVILLASYPILTRLYDSTSFGLLATFSSIVAILAIFATLRYELAIPLAQDESDANIILYLCIVLSVGWSLVLLGVVGLISDQMLTRLGYQQLQNVKWLVPLAVFGSGLYGAFTYWGIRRKSFSAIATTQISKIGGEVGLQTIFGFFSFGALGLIIGNFAGFCLGVGTLVRAGRPYLKLPNLPVLWQLIKAMAKRYRRFPLFNGAATFMNEGSSRLFLLGIGIYYSQADLGLFWLALMLLGALAGVAISSAQKVYYAHAAELHRTKSVALRSYYLKAVMYTAAIATPIGVMAYFFIPPVFKLLFQQDWIASVSLIMVLIPGFVFKTAILPFLSYNIIEKQHIALIWNTIHMVLHLVTIPIALYISPDLFTLAATYSAALCLSYFLLFLIHMAILPKRKTKGNV